MTEPPAIACDHEHGCITCGDEAVPMRVVRVDADARARAVRGPRRASGRPSRSRSSTRSRDGDRLLVHAGTALQVLA